MIGVACGARRIWPMPHGRSLAARDGITPARHAAAARKTASCRPTRRALAPTGPTGPGTQRATVTALPDHHSRVHRTLSQAAHWSSFPRPREAIRPIPHRRLNVLFLCLRQCLRLSTIEGMRDGRVLTCQARTDKPCSILLLADKQPTSDHRQLLAMDCAVIFQAFKQSCNPKSKRRNCHGTGEGGKRRQAASGNGGDAC